MNTNEPRTQENTEEQIDKFARRVRCRVNKKDGRN